MNQLKKFDGLIQKDRVIAKREEEDFLSLFGANSAQVSRFDKTAIVLVLDESSSMSSQRERAITAVAAIEKEFPQASFVKVVFSSRVDRKQDFRSYSPCGMTAMFDGILGGIAIAQAELSHNNVVHITITDGEENASTASLPETAQAIAEKKALGWQFYAIWLTEQGLLNGHQRDFEKLGVPLARANDITQAVQKISDGIYGYLATGTLLLE